MKKFKKGFTLLELVIVIAVVAILAAILIPTFAGIIKRSRLSNDTMLCKNLNTAATAVQIADDQKPVTMSIVLNAMSENGFNVDKIKTSNDDNIVVYDSLNNKFFIYDYVANKISFKDESTTINMSDKAHKVNYWIISDTYTQTNENLQGFSIYLKDGYTGGNTIEVNTGFDVGNNVFDTVSYVNSGAAQTVTVRTNGGTFVVNAPNDTVIHYGEAGIVDVQQINTTSYHEKGKTTFVKVTSGRVVVEKVSEVGGLYVAAETAILAQAPEADLPTITISSEVTTFKLQTTNTIGEKVTESTVTIGDESYGIKTNQTDEALPAVPQQVKVKVERDGVSKAELIKTEEEAIEEAAETVAPTGVARIGVKGYATFKDAVDAAVEGDVIVILSDFDIDSTIGEINETANHELYLVSGVQNEVVFNADTKIVFKNTAQVYMLDDALFTLNGHTLTVSFDYTCDITKKSGFMNCTIPTLYHGIHNEHVKYTFENNVATVKGDFKGMEEWIVGYGLIYTSESCIIVSGPGDSTDNMCYDESEVNATYIDGVEQSGSNQVSRNIGIGEHATIYLASGAANYNWRTYRNYIGWEENSTYFTITENKGSYVVVEGLKNDSGMNGEMVKLVVDVTAQDGTVTTYEWRFMVTGGNSGLPGGNPGFGPGLGPDIPGGPIFG